MPSQSSESTDAIASMLHGPVPESQRLARALRSISPNEMPPVPRLVVRITVLVSTVVTVFSIVAWANTSTSCDVNGDGKVDVADVQLITNMEINAPGFPCVVNIGGVLGCTDAARAVVIKATLGNGCYFNYLTWKASRVAGIVGYNVYRGTSPDVSAARLLNRKGPVPATAYADVDAVAGTKYYYFVKPTDGSKERAPTIEPAVWGK